MKKLTIAAVLIALTSVVVFGASQVRAETSTSRYDSLVSIIATKFNLNTQDVQQVFDENRAEHQSMMQSNFEDRLTKAVTDGKITQEQKQLILAKHQELVANKVKYDTLTFQERQDAMQKEHDEFKSWADQNGIDSSLFMGGWGNKGEGMGRGGMGMRMGGRGF